MREQILELQENHREGTVTHIRNTNNFPVAKIFPASYNSAFKSTLVSVFNDPRMIDFNRKRHETGDQAVWHMIETGGDIHLSALASYLDFEKTSKQPSIAAMLSGEIDRQFIIPLVMKILDNLSFYFLKKPNPHIEEMAWQILQEYSHFSILDVLLFAQKCKRKQYATEFDHPESKGLNPGHFRNWIEKFDLGREEFLQNERIKFWESNEIIHPQIMKRIQPAIDNLKRTEVTHEKKKSKLFQLKCEFEEGMNELSLRDKFVNDYVNNYLLFQIENHQKPAKELKLLAETQLKNLTSEWERQIERAVEFNALKEWGGSKTEAVESYIQSKLRGEIRTIQKSYSLLTSIGILEMGLSQLIEIKETSTVDSLLKFLPDVNVNNPINDLNRFRTELVLHLQKRILKGWKIREEKIVNDDALYMNQERFCKFAAWHWVSKNCFDNPGIPQT